MTQALKKIRIDQGSIVPVNIQLARGLEAAITDGDFEQGERMPTVREIAVAFGIDTRTVQRAVDILRGDGLVVSHGTRGTFVAHLKDLDELRERRAKRFVRETLADIRRLGLDLPTILRMMSPPEKKEKS